MRPRNRNITIGGERARHRPVTIADVAKEAGVSVATVSKVINERYGVAEETSDRVRAVIERVGYQSSLVAQSLRSRHTNVIGVLAADIEPFNAEVLRGVAQGIRGSGYDLIVFSDCGAREDQQGWEQRNLARISSLTDGVLLITPSVVAVDSVGPVVAIDHNIGASSLPSVDADNLQAAVTATQYLLELGHERVGFLAGRQDLASARRREHGYRLALESAGIAFDPRLVAVGGFEPRQSQLAAAELLGLAERPTAIFAANDVSALEVVRVAKSLKLRVPEDLSVIGFDNVPDAALSDPPLTTIDQFVQRMGSRAVEVLIGLIDDPTREPEQVVLGTELVIRSSCAPPPDAA
jgi:LacI family transcriptional regulator